MIKQVFWAIIVFLIGLQSVSGQRYIKRLERWERKQKYEKIARKSNKFVKKFSNDPRVFYYATNSELKLATKATNRKKGYKHVLNSVNYYTRYESKIPAAQVSIELKNALHTEVKAFYRYFEEKKNAKSVRALDMVLASTFKDTTNNFRDYLAQKGSPKKSVEPAKSNKKAISKDRRKIIEEADKHQGKPYKYASKGPESFDCSGFTRYVFLTVTGYELPHNAALQSQLGKEIKPSDAQIGDLIFFGDPKNKKINHTGIVYKIGNGDVCGVIHSISKGVTVDTDEYVSWTNHWKGKIVKIVNIIDYIDNP